MHKSAAPIGGSRPMGVLIEPLQVFGHERFGGVPLLLSDEALSRAVQPMAAAASEVATSGSLDASGWP